MLRVMGPSFTRDVERAGEADEALVANRREDYQRVR
jgi:hypothetical protein